MCAVQSQVLYGQTAAALFAKAAALQHEVCYSEYESDCTAMARCLRFFSVSCLVRCRHHPTATSFRLDPADPEMSSSPLARTWQPKGSTCFGGDALQWSLEAIA